MDGAMDLRLLGPPVPPLAFRVPLPSDSAPQSRMLGRLEAFLLSCKSYVQHKKISAYQIIIAIKSSQWCP